MRCRRFVEIGHGKIGKELVEAVEADGKELSAGGMGEGLGQMGFAGAGGTQQKRLPRPAR